MSKKLTDLCQLARGRCVGWLAIAPIRRYVGGVGLWRSTVCCRQEALCKSVERLTTQVESGGKRTVDRMGPRNVLQYGNSSESASDVRATSHF